VATLGPRLSFVSPAGSINAAPAGFSNSTGRLFVTLPSGSATWISLTGGQDGQLLEIANGDAVNTLILPQAQWGGVGDHELDPGNRILCYYDLPNTAWKVTAP
jgi:hypothetical protein